MITPTQAFSRYGRPELEQAMVLFDVPRELEIGAIPKRIYCNRDLVKPLHTALEAVVKANLAGLIKTWDGCFNIRKQRGARVLSLHSWGLAVDINAAWNRLGFPSTQDPRLVKAFTDAGFDWGGVWQRPDAQHFQLHAFPS